MIEVENLVKEFKVVKKEKGVKGSLMGLIRPDKQTVRAVDGISFTVGKGEIAAYIGPNGAGKSTMIKMLSGILHPTSGSIRVNGISPQQERRRAVQDIGVVFGQRTQLYWDLRLGETFELLKRMYRISNMMYEENLSIMDEALQIKQIIDVPVRQLSLGQRMRGDLAAAVLHSPSILFLDEPTIGLDLQAKASIRKFILDMNRIKETTVILTTHDLDDVEELCDRLIIVNRGRMIEDGPLKNIVDRIAPYRYLVVDLAVSQQTLDHPFAEVTKQEGTRFWLKFSKQRISASELVSDLIKRYAVTDISVKEPDIEDVVREVYMGQKGQ